MKRLTFTNDYCFRAKYTYLISSVNEKDTKGQQGNGIMNFASQILYSTLLQRVLVMETADDLRNLHEFQTCNYDEIPRRFPISDDGFDRQYTFSMSSEIKPSGKQEDRYLDKKPLMSFDEAISKERPAQKYVWHSPNQRRASGQALNLQPL